MTNAFTQFVYTYTSGRVMQVMRRWTDDVCAELRKNFFRHSLNQLYQSIVFHTQTHAHTDRRNTNFTDLFSNDTQIPSAKQFVVVFVLRRRI